MCTRLNHAQKYIETFFEISLVCYFLGTFKIKQVTDTVGVVEMEFNVTKEIKNNTQ